ncbi:hypothetical protein [Arthrobacter psychrolactophilus]
MTWWYRLFHRAIKKLSRNAAMDGVNVYRRLDLSTPETSVADPARIDAVLAEIRKLLETSLASESTVRGWRAQALFASLVAALDGCDLMTLVDTGEIYFDGPSVKAPDYFLHLRSGRRLLVDVKAVRLRDENPLEMPIKFGASEVNRMQRFGEQFGAEVFIAFYFPEMLIWALVPLTDLCEGPGGGFRTTVRESVIHNQIGLLGDLHVGTVSPLECIIIPDPTKKNEIDESGQAHFTVGSIEFRAGGNQLTSKAEKQLAYFLMLHGSWIGEQTPIHDDGKIAELRIVAQPVENSGQGFDIVGSLSSMYSKLFESSTSDHLGVTSLDISVKPGMLVSLVPHDYDSSTLPIWRFKTSHH